jgi:SAM-dependent methyltransferase
VTGYSLLQCRTCNFVRLSLPDQFDLASLYGSDYFYGRGFDQSRLIPESRNPNPAFVMRRRWWLGLLGDATGGTGRLLDIGCGAGGLLDVAVDMHWEAEGQEIAATGAAEAKSRGHRVQVAELADCDYQPGSFDAATLIEVIEHLKDPTSTLIACRRALRSGGWLLVTTGDIGSWIARLMGCHWDYIRPPGHVSYFTLQSLTQLLTRCGFSHVETALTYDVAYPSFPGRSPARSALSKWAAINVRRLTRRDLCIMARA